MASRFATCFTTITARSCCVGLIEGTSVVETSLEWFLSLLDDEQPTDGVFCYTWKRAPHVTRLSIVDILYVRSCEFLSQSSSNSILSVESIKFIFRLEYQYKDSGSKCEFMCDHSFTDFIYIHMFLKHQTYVWSQISSHIKRHVLIRVSSVCTAGRDSAQLEHGKNTRMENITWDTVLRDQLWRFPGSLSLAEKWVAHSFCEALFPGQKIGSDRQRILLQHGGHHPTSLDTDTHVKDSYSL